MNYFVIRSSLDGFRRCGAAHPAAAVVHPEVAFSEADWERLSNEPRLMVRDATAEEVEAYEALASGGGVEGLTDEQTEAVETVIDALDGDAKITVAAVNKGLKDLGADFTVKRIQLDAVLNAMDGAAGQ